MNREKKREAPTTMMMMLCSECEILWRESSENHEQKKEITQNYWNISGNLRVCWFNQSHSVLCTSIRVLQVADKIQIHYRQPKKPERNSQFIHEDFSDLMWKFLSVTEKRESVAKANENILISLTIQHRNRVESGKEWSGEKKVE